jgi:hypothetical protein
MAIKVKAAERAMSHLTIGEIIAEILKLEAFRKEGIHQKTNLASTLVII